MPKRKNKQRNGAGGKLPTPAEGLVITEAMVFQACKSGDLAQLRLWGQQGVCVTTWKALEAASASNQLDVMRCLAKEFDADINQIAGDNRETALQVACYWGRLAMVLCLVLELGADVDTKDDDGLTPLHIAAVAGNIDMLRCLLNDLNADVDKEHSTGATASLFAADTGHLNVMRCLVREHGADINHANNFGETALIIAAANNEAALAKWLVKAGADPQARNSDNKTAADISRLVGASSELTTYLEAKAHCAQPGCSGAGTKKCQGCMQGRYCGPACHVAHWPAHKVECRRLGAALKSAQEEGGK
jgi:hypothetical protein